MTKEERERLKRFVPMREMPILREGERPGETVLTAEGKIEKRFLEGIKIFEDTTIGDMTILDKNEIFGHTIQCNQCGVRFQAYKEHEHVWRWENIFYFCPGCGCELVDRSDEKTVEQIKKILED